MLKRNSKVERDTDTAMPELDRANLSMSRATTPVVRAAHGNAVDAKV